MSTGKLIGLMAVFVVLGMPLVWYLWTVVNEVLTGHVNGRHVLIALPVLVVFLALLVLLSKAVRRWDESLH